MNVAGRPERQPAVRPTKAPAAAAIVADPDFARLKAEIVARTGHYYFADKDAMLAERLARRLQAARLASLAAYRALLAMPRAGAEEWQILEAEITVGETFFFRYAEQFAALRAAILPRLIEARRRDRRIRIWSAGCANGAEPYSVAVVLAELLGAEMPDWRVSILGTDLSATALAAAAEARYGNWALRAVPAEERLRLFEPAGPAEWRLRPHFRRMVHFRRSNLLALAPGTDLALAGFDLILCRNVLIYFHPEAAGRMVGELVRRLTPEGLLLLGHAELSLVPPPGAARVEIGAVTAFRPAVEASAPPADAETGAAAWTPVLPPPAAPAPPAPVAARPPPEAPARGPLPLPDAVTAVAGAERLAGAAPASGHPLDAGVHFHQGMLAQEAGDRRAAEAALRRALFLDRGFAVAHLFLGILLAGRGAAAAARRAFANAVAVAAALPPEAEVPEGGGMTAGELVVLARAHHARLRAEQRA